MRLMHAIKGNAMIRLDGAADRRKLRLLCNAAGAGGIEQFPKQPPAEIEISDLCDAYRPTFLNVIGPVTYQSPFLLTVEHLLRPLSHRVNFMQSTFPCSRQTPVSALPIFP
jgi:hypothetical protein